MENSGLLRRDEFLRRLKEEWQLMWRERFDDKVRAEGVAVRDYPMLLIDRGFVIFASRDVKAPSFSEVVDFWASQGYVYVPNPIVGGWGKFIRTEIRKLQSKAKMFNEDQRKRGREGKKQQLKKGGRGWLHIE
ncbi:MAG: hypothetical protein QXF61_06960 [Nitrososphaeria archaeon]